MLGRIPGVGEVAVIGDIAASVVRDLAGYTRQMLDLV
jgi:hypothetical protein